MTTAARIDGARRWLTGEARTRQEVRDEVYLFEGDAAAKQSRFWLLLVLSATIATAGVVGDSTATVIGAMIVAPLAIPIQGIAAAIAGGETRPLFLSLGTVVGAGLVVVGIAAALSAILPELHAPEHNSQITSRTSPTVVDLAAATATGLAGALAVSRRDIGDILPGVAIAISLVPPLAVVGISAADGRWGSAGGALLLFVTNVVAMIVVGVFVFAVVAGLRDGSLVDPRFKPRHVYSVVAIASLIVFVALAVLTRRTVQLSAWRSAAADIGQQWALDRDQRVVSTRYVGSDLVFVVEQNRGSASEIAADDAALVRELAGAVPAGTLVVVNRLAGERHPAGRVP